MTPGDLRATRKRMGKTQKDLAEDLGVTVQHLSNLERGTVRVAKVYGLACRYLLEKFLSRPVI